MIFSGSYAVLGDNSGATFAQVIRLMSRPKNRWSSMGDTILVAVKKARAMKKVKKSDKCRMVLVNTKAFVTRATFAVGFSNSIGVILKKEEIVPTGSRVRAFVPLELKVFGFRRIVTMAAINL